MSVTAVHVISGERKASAVLSIVAKLFPALKRGTPFSIKFGAENFDLKIAVSDSIIAHFGRSTAHWPTFATQSTQVQTFRCVAQRLAHSTASQATASTTSSIQASSSISSSRCSK